MDIIKIYQLLQQYGYTPRVLLARITNTKAPKVIANSIPKAGTNLLIRSLYLLSPMHRSLEKTININDVNFVIPKVERLNRGQFLATHLKYSEELYQLLLRNSTKNILMIRDPRDIAISNSNYITYKDPSHRLHRYFKSLSSDSDRLMASIQGVEGCLLIDKIPSLSLASHINAYLPWIDKPSILVVRFEDLVGCRGGGNDDIQLRTLKKIVDYLELSIGENIIKEAAKKIFNPKSRTFVKGQIGLWKDVLEDKHKVIIKKEMGDIIIRLGYEKHNKW